MTQDYSGTIIDGVDYSTGGVSYPKRKKENWFSRLINHPVYSVLFGVCLALGPIMALVDMWTTTSLNSTVMTQMAQSSSLAERLKLFGFYSFVQIAMQVLGVAFFSQWDASKKLRRDLRSGLFIFTGFIYGVAFVLLTGVEALMVYSKLTQVNIGTMAGGDVIKQYLLLTVFCIAMALALIAIRLAPMPFMRFSSPEQLERVTEERLMVRNIEVKAITVAYYQERQAADMRAEFEEHMRRALLGDGTDATMAKLEPLIKAYHQEGDERAFTVARRELLRLAKEAGVTLESLLQAPEEFDYIRRGSDIGGKRRFVHVPTFRRQLMSAGVQKALQPPR